MIGNNSLKDIHIRDPFILLDNGIYYMYGTRGREAFSDKATGLDVFKSDDLVNWSSAYEVFKRPEGFWADRHFWAPEVHKYKGRYYMFVSFKAEDKCRGTQILVSDTPLGPFNIHSAEPVTPDKWECLDGTLYVEEDIPYIVFCHEWTQIVDGEICALRLSEDLKESIGEPITLFSASSVDFVKNTPSPEFLIGKDGTRSYVTDGPFLYRMSDGGLGMLWSSFFNGDYCVITSYSDNGKITGNWKYEEMPLFEKDGGHGMILKTKEGQMLFPFHYPNNIHGEERPKFMVIKEENGKIVKEDKGEKVYA